MNVSKISSVNINNTVRKLNLRHNALPLCETALAGSIPIFLNSKIDGKEYAGRRQEQTKNFLALGVAMLTTIPLNKQVQKWGSKVVSKLKPDIKPIASDVLRNAKYVLPIVNALTIAPLVVSKILMPLNEKIGELSRDGREDKEAILKIGDYLKEPLKA